MKYEVKESSYSNYLNFSKVKVELARCRGKIPLTWLDAAVMTSESRRATLSTILQHAALGCLLISGGRYISGKDSKG